MKNIEKYDVIVIGGSYSGLSAALALGRAIRKVLVIDNNMPCNQQTPHSHNFLTRDGNTPAAIAALGKSEVMQYSTVEFLAGYVDKVNGENNNFEVFTVNGEVLYARKLLFSTGIKDLQPAIPGFSACWGISVIHCPYCHGYEYRDQVTGILANGDAAFEMALMVHNWTKLLTVFTNGRSDLTKQQQEKLTNMKIDIVEKPFLEINHDEGHLNNITFVDRSQFFLSALYARLPFQQHCKVPEEMGCEITASGYIQVDDFQKTSMDGIFASGDNTSKLRSVSAAVAAGSRAGAFINHELVVEG